MTTQYQEQFSNSQEARVKEFAEAQTQRQAHDKELTEKVENLFTEEISAFSKYRESLAVAHSEQLKQLKIDYDSSAIEILADIKRRKEAVEKLAGIIWNVGLTSGYVNAASHARRRSFFWQAVTVVALLGLISTAVAPLIYGWYTGTFPAVTWENLTARVFIAVAIVVLAAYSAVQGDRNAEIEKLNSRLALELEAIGPYLAPLPEETQNEFRVEIGKKTFGRDEYHQSRERAKSPANVFELMKSKDLREFIIELVKVSKG